MPDKSVPEARLFDGFLTDEYAAANTQGNVMGNPSARMGLFKNKFTTVTTSGSATTEIFQTGVFDLKNMADPASNAALNSKSPGFVKNPIDPGFEGLTHAGDYGFAWYCSDEIINFWKGLNGAAWDHAKKIQLTILFGPRNILCRSGVRSFFQNSKNFNAILQVPGLEPGYLTNAKGNQNKGRWGVSINDTEIARQFKSFFGVDVPFDIVVLAAYSTGINGLNQTLLNDICTLSKVKRIIVFDCLYVSSSGSTGDAIKKIKRLNNNVQIMIYWSSLGKGNSMNAAMTDLTVVQNLAPVLSNGTNVIKLAGKPHYRCLICSRMIQAGLKDGLITLSKTAETSFHKLEAVLPARGTVISDAAKFKSFVSAGPPSRSVALDDWYKTNKGTVDDFNKFLGAAAGNTASPIAQIWSQKVPGWGGSVGEEVHDFLIPEFGWEYLLG
jgi:hypothetical protein